MRLLKHLFIGITGIGIVLLLISFLLSAHVRVSKSVMVNSPRDSVANALMHITRWKHWNPLLQDSSITYAFPAENHVTWTSADGKKNSIELQHYAADSIVALVTTNNKKVFTTGFTMVHNTDGTGLTKVEWWISEDLAWYPWEKFYGLFAESLKETYLENSLQSFKRYMEEGMVRNTAPF